MVAEKEACLRSLGAAVEKAEKRLDDLEEASDRELEKIESRLAMFKETLFNPPPSEISVLATDLIVNLATKIEEVTQNVMNKHKEVHRPVSKIGKEIEKNFIKEVNDLVKNEKDIEEEGKNKNVAEAIVFDYLLASGYVDLATTFVKEVHEDMETDPTPCQLAPSDCICHRNNLLVPDEEGCSKLEVKQSDDMEIQRVRFEEFKEAMCSMQCRNVLPALDWLEKYAPAEHRLKFDLKKQIIVEMAREGKRREAMDGMKLLKDMGYIKDFQLLCGAIVRPKDARYEQLFSPIAWTALEARMAEAAAPCVSRLEDILETGIYTAQSLFKLKRTVGHHKSHLFTQDELPIEIKLSKPVHNTFVCPILKAVGTETNPPMRLHCGHVISNDALNRLGNSQRVNYRVVRCPYCPQESIAQDAKRVQI